MTNCPGGFWCMQFKDWLNVAILIPTILWADILNPYIWIVLFVTLAYGAIGFVDDYRKLIKKHNLGLTAKQKFTLQFIVAAAAGIAIAWLPSIHNNYSTVLTFPFIKPELFKLNLHWLYVPFIMLVLVAASNSVNLTDGLDGLAIGSTLIVGVTYTVLTYAAGNFKIADYLRIAWVPQAGEDPRLVFAGVNFENWLAQRVRVNASYDDIVTQRVRPGRRKLEIASLCLDRTGKRDGCNGPGVPARLDWHCIRGDAWTRREHRRYYYTTFRAGGRSLRSTRLARWITVRATGGGRSSAGSSSRTGENGQAELSAGSV